MTTQQQTFLSHFGFHPCDKETYLKLKRLCRLCQSAIQRNWKWQTWNRKHPRNRFEWDNPHGTGSPGGAKKKRSNRPIPEPKRCPVWSRETESIISLNCVRARYPQQTPQQVKPLTLTIQQIDKLLSGFEKWHKG